MAIPTNNPLKILKELDKQLKETGGKTDLILFGRAAIVMGFKNCPEEIKATHDVDAILPTTSLQEEENFEFWDALNKTNEVLDGDLQITHLFEEKQIILTADWYSKKVKIESEFENIVLYRPSTCDLILTKMMRGTDDKDIADIEFYIKSDNLSEIE